MVWMGASFNPQQLNEMGWVVVLVVIIWSNLSFQPLKFRGKDLRADKIVHIKQDIIMGLRILPS